MVQFGGTTVALALGKGDGTFQTLQTANTGSPTISPVAEGDFNGDGNADLSVATEGGWVAVLLGTGTGTVGSPINTTPPSGMYPCSIVAGDFNGDGKTDLASTTALNNNNYVLIMLSNGDGTFTAGASYPVGSAASAPYPYIISADFNDDGRLDLAVVNPNRGGLFILLGNGDGTFQSPVSIGTDARSRAGCSPRKWGRYLSVRNCL